MVYKFVSKGYPSERSCVLAKSSLVCMLARQCKFNVSPSWLSQFNNHHKIVLKVFSGKTSANEIVVGNQGMRMSQRMHLTL